MSNRRVAAFRDLACPSSVVEVTFCLSVGLSSVEESAVFRRFKSCRVFAGEVRARKPIL